MDKRLIIERAIDMLDYGVLCSIDTFTKFSKEVDLDLYADTRVVVVSFYEWSKLKK